MGVVVRRQIDFLVILLMPTPLVLALFCSNIPPSLFIKKNGFRSLYAQTVWLLGMVNFSFFFFSV